MVDFDDANENKSENVDFMKNIEYRLFRKAIPLIIKKSPLVKI